ncbi:hypothetical protein [Brevundimonas diminuta]|uniref:hypothetical protein n=1 Tax=Brevundimonas diminuta TaxID=293 RepID=UPI001F588876|nr:hypothetical protein [Brevundimonas diminuta]
MVRRVLIFLICPLVLGFGLAQWAQAAGIRTAGIHWLASVFYYLIFALPGLVLVVRLGRGKRRDFVEAAGALGAMATGILVWATLGYGAFFNVVEADGPRRYTIMEAALFGLRDAAFNVTLAGLALAASLIGVRLIEAGIRAVQVKAV